MEITDESTLPSTLERARFETENYLFQVRKDHTVMSARQDHASVIFDEAGISNAIKKYHAWASENKYYQVLYYVGF